MKQVAGLWFIAVFFATLSLPVLAAERNDEAPIFYLGYNIGSCAAKASGIGKITATYLYYWDIAANDNRVAQIMNVSRALKPGYYGSARKGRKSVTVEISARLGLLVSAKTCKV